MKRADEVPRRPPDYDGIYLGYFEWIHRGCYERPVLVWISPDEPIPYRLTGSADVRTGGRR